MKPIALDFGVFTVRWYAIFIVTGIILGTLLAKSEAKRHNLDDELLMDYIFYVIIWGFIGARIWYVIFSFDYYSTHVSEILQIWHGGLAIHGGLLGGLLYTIYFTKRNNINILLMSDLAAPSLLLAQSIGRFGNFMNSEAHGPATSRQFLSSVLHLPDFIVQGMDIDGIYYQPTFLYESLWNIIGFLIITLFLRKRYRNKYGQLTAFYLIWYGFIRFFIEFLRTDALMFGSIRVAQVASLIMILTGLIIIWNNRHSKKNEHNDFIYD